MGSAQEDECGKAFVGLVVSRRDSPELFEIAEEVFDEMPPAIHGEVACNGLLSIRLWRDDDFRLGFLKQVAQVIVVEALVGQKCLHIDAVDQVRRGNAVVTLVSDEKIVALVDALPNLTPPTGAFQTETLPQADVCQRALFDRQTTFGNHSRKKCRSFSCDNEIVGVRC